MDETDSARRKEMKQEDWLLLRPSDYSFVIAVEEITRILHYPKRLDNLSLYRVLKRG
jgi:hypothetical protein